jgi:hypothetical protein
MSTLTKSLSLIFLFIALESSNSSIESDRFCSYESDEIEQNVNQCKPNPSYSYSTDPEYLSTFPEVLIPVVFWGINQTDGSNEDPLTKTKVLESIELLNSAFKEMKICFELKELKFIDDSEIYWSDYYKFNKHVKANYPASSEVLNIYVPFRFSNFENNLRGGKWSSNQLSVNMLNYNTGILPHEVGHILGLLHTHTGEKAMNCEYITRDESDPDYNAKCAGDRVTDTNAMPNLYGKFHMINQECEYEGDIKNCEGELYQLTEKDVRNFMGYTQHACRSTFTVGQGVRVREFIRNKKKEDKLGFIKPN